LISDWLRASGPQYVVVASALLAALALSLGVASLNACFGGPADLGAVEVVLNKPGLSFNFTALTSLKGVTVVNDGVAAYESHLSRKLVVMVFFDSVSISGNATKYLVVRIQAPVKLVNVTVREYAWENTLRNVNTSPSMLEDVAANLGWVIKATEHVDGTLTAYLMRDAGNCSLTLWVEGKPARNESASTYDLHVSMKGIGNSECITNAVTTLLRRVTGKSIGVNPKLINEHTQQRIKVGVDESTLKAALAYELKWLESVGVIKGLSNEDITAILKAAKAGTAGWNSRLVYANGAWMPYNEALKYIPGSTLIRGCGDITKLVSQANLSVPETPATTLTTTTVIQATPPPQQPPTTEPQEQEATINPQALTIAALAGTTAATTAWLIAKHKH